MPTDNSRATLVVANSTQCTAIYGACDLCQNIAVRNVQVNGNRPALGQYGGAGLLEMGGNTKGQTVDNCHLYEYVQFAPPFPIGD